MPKSYYVLYQSYTPDGKVWCVTDNLADFLEYNAQWVGEGDLWSKKTIAARPVAFSTK